MGISIIGFLLAAVGLVALALQRFYSGIPAKELRRLASRGDHLASALYRAVAYGVSLRLFLWIIVSGGLTGGILLLAQSLPGFVAFVVITSILLVGFVLLQSARLTVRTAGFAALVAPGLGAVLGWIEPVFGRVTRGANRRRRIEAHSGLYEKEDLTDLLDQQKNQVDNRISHDELELARRALHFDETQVAETMLPRPQMKSLKASDTIGPILLEELHKSGQAQFVVYDDSGEQTVGVLQMADAIRAKEGGKVSAIMTQDLTYVHEDFTLRQAADALVKSGQQLALVINAFEELVGVISLDSLLAELLGPARDTDLAYRDRAAVAAYKPAEPEAGPEPDETPPEATDEPMEGDAKTQGSDDASSSEAPEVVK